MSDTLLAEVEVNLLQLAILLGCDDIAEDMLQMAKEHIKSVVCIPVSKSTKEEWVRSTLEFIRVRDTIFHKFLNSKILIRNQKEVLTLKQRWCHKYHTFRAWISADLSFISKLYFCRAQGIDGMNIIHTSLRFNQGVMFKLVEFVEDKLSLNQSQKYQLMNGQTRFLKKTPLHFVSKFDGSSDSLKYKNGLDWF